MTATGPRPLHSEDSTTGGTPLEDDRRPDLSGRHLEIRADAGPSLGLGHAMRCLALAQGWADAGGTVRLVSDNPPPPVLSRWRKEGVRVTGPSDHAEAAEPSPDWIVIDGPHLPIETAIGPGARVLVIDDDGGRTSYPCDLLLNQNAGAEPRLYNGKTQGRLLLGPEHALLRRDLRAWRDWQRPNPPTARSLLITFGGSDPGRHTERALDALTLMANGQSIETRLLVGGGNPRLAEIRNRVAGLQRIELVHDARDVGALIRESDLVISAAGSTLWELALLGTPMLIGAAVPVEHGPARAMAARGAAIDLGPLADLSAERLAEATIALIGDQERRAMLSAAARSVVDGRGVDRVLNAMYATLEGLNRPRHGPSA